MRLIGCAPNYTLHEGITPPKKMMDELLNSRPGGQTRRDVFGSTDSNDRGINFTMFLTMMSERLFEFDVESELLEAFESFDENDSGVVKVDEIKKWLSEVGERMDSYEVRLPLSTHLRLAKENESMHTQIDRFLKGPFTDRQGNFNYREWVKVLRVNEENEESQQQQL